MTVNNSINAPNAVIQKVSSSTSSLVTCTTILPLDNTIPQNTEGDEVLTVSITPKSATNNLVIDFISYGASSGVNIFCAMALFQDTTTNSLGAAHATGTVTTQILSSFSLRHIMTAGTTSSTTFKIRCGPNTTGSFYINGSGGTAKYGGVSLTTLTVTEYKA